SQAEGRAGLQRCLCSRQDQCQGPGTPGAHESRVGRELQPLPIFAMSKEPKAKADTPEPTTAPQSIILDETPEFARLFREKIRAGLTDAQARECALNRLRHDQALAQAAKNA